MIPFNKLCKQGPEGIAFSPDSGGLQHPSVAQLSKNGNGKCDLGMEYIGKWNGINIVVDCEHDLSQKTYLGVHILILKVVSSLQRRDGEYHSRITVINIGFSLRIPSLCSV